VPNIFRQSRHLNLGSLNRVMLGLLWISRFPSYNCLSSEISFIIKCGDIRDRALLVEAGARHWLGKRLRRGFRTSAAAGSPCSFHLGLRLGSHRCLGRGRIPPDLHGLPLRWFPRDSGCTHCRRSAAAALALCAVIRSALCLLLAPLALALLAPTLFALATSTIARPQHFLALALLGATGRLRSVAARAVPAAALLAPLYP